MLWPSGKIRDERKGYYGCLKCTQARCHVCWYCFLFLKIFWEHFKMSAARAELHKRYTKTHTGHKEYRDIRHMNYLCPMKTKKKRIKQ